MSAMSTAIGRDVSQTIRLAVPVVVGQWAAVAMGFVDTVMVGRVSAEALAAVAVGGSLWATVMLFLTGVVMALPPTLAQARGARRLDRCSRDRAWRFWESWHSWLLEVCCGPWMSIKTSCR
jgi:MATE family multidrug resistance protein